MPKFKVGDIVVDPRKQYFLILKIMEVHSLKNYDGKYVYEAIFLSKCEKKYIFTEGNERFSRSMLESYFIKIKEEELDSLHLLYQ